MAPTMAAPRRGAHVAVRRKRHPLVEPTKAHRAPQKSAADRVSVPKYTRLKFDDDKKTGSMRAAKAMAAAARVAACRRRRSSRIMTGAQIT